MPVKIKEIKTKSGDHIRFGSLTLLIGHNNSGKSQVLRDIRDFFYLGQNGNSKLVDEVIYQLPDDINAYVAAKEVSNYPDRESVAGVSSNLIEKNSNTYYKGWLERTWRDKDVREIFQNLGKFFIAHLHAETRFGLTSPQECYDLVHDEPSHVLQEFFKKRETAQDDLRASFRSAFGKDIALDYSAMRKWFFRVGDDFGKLSDEVALLNRQLLSGEHLTNQGDGYRSFAGIVMATLTFPDRILLLDEPEAFLHPSQARFLGQWLAEKSKTRIGQILISTHSADFLSGVVEGSSEAQVVRLQRRNNHTKFTTVDSTVTMDLAQSPLLSSQPVLEALFHKGVVVCEGDPDRAFYQAISRSQRLEKRGDDMLFIHTNGKGAMNYAIDLLRKSGTPVCAIADIDIINSKDIFSKVFSALTGADLRDDVEERRKNISNWVGELTEDEMSRQINESVEIWKTEKHGSARAAKKNLENKLKLATSKWEPVKKDGLGYFKNEQQKFVHEFLLDLRRYGLFVVPRGELEGWMQVHAAKGREWNRKALESVKKEVFSDDLEDFAAGFLSYLESGGAVG